MSGGERGSQAADGRRESTKAPVMWSHSDVRHYNNLSRNVPDEVLDKIGKGHGRVDGVVMVK